MAFLGCSVDWLAFTLPVGDLASMVDAVENVCQWFGGSGGDMAHGRSGYSSGRFVLGTGSVMWSPDRLDMGVHVELPSKALGAAGWEVVDLLGIVLERHGHFTRMDVALDTDAVTVAQVVEMESSGVLVSRTQNRRLITDLRTGGQTLYVGSAQSRRLVRIYDKAVEQETEDGHIWTRIEVQFRGEYAQRAAIYAFAGHALEDLIISAIDFRDDDDINVTRRTRSAWWSELIGAAQSLRFAVTKAADTIAELYNWLNVQVAPTLALLCMFFGGYQWLVKLADSGVERVQPWRLSLLT